MDTNLALILVAGGAALLFLSRREPAPAAPPPAPGGAGDAIPLPGGGTGPSTAQTVRDAVVGGLETVPGIIDSIARLANAADED